MTTLPRAEPAATRWREGGRELGLGLSVFAVYLLTTHLISADSAVADAHGRTLLATDEWLHIAWERPLNSALHGHEILGALAAWEYAVTYIVTTFGVLGWLWWKRPQTYPWARNTLVITTLIAVACFALWPATPPRLLPDTSFVDVVAGHHPPLSWGSGTVSAGADQYAAMPSLHIGWAVWVTAVTLRSGASRTGKLLGAGHVLLTAVVVLATANHYMTDVLAGTALVGVALLLERTRAAVAAGPVARGSLAWWPRLADRALPARRPGQRVAPEDAFFLYVETGAVPQHVGGIALLDLTGLPAGTPSLADVRRLVAGRLPDLPRLTQRVLPGGLARHPRWVPDPAVDVTAHVEEVVLPPGAGRAGLDAFVGRVAARPLPADRPLWQLWLVRDVAPDRAAVVVVMHHAIADGLGVVDILRTLLDPVLPAVDAVPALPSAWRRGVATVAGLGQLAADGPARPLPFTVALRPSRAFRTLALDLAGVRAAARRRGVRVSDLLLTALGETAAAAVAEAGTDPAGRRLRVAVPMTLRAPAPPGSGRRAVPGNLTAALRLDVPLDRMSPTRRLAVTHAAAEQRRRSGRAPASAAVMRLLGVLPARLHAAAARAIYNGRFFTAIMSNMPAPDARLRFAGAPLAEVFPLLPLADDVPLAVGTLGWSGRLCLSVTMDPTRLPDPDTVVDRLGAALAALVGPDGAEVGAADPVADAAEVPPARRGDGTAVVAAPTEPARHSGPDGDPSAPCPWSSR